MKPKFFPTPADFRAWFESHHDTEAELLVGFHKKGSGKPSMTWPESVDEALCFGWIDGVRRSLGETAYTIRFTPRRPTSIWSAINVARVGELTKLGRMREAGLRAFAARRPERTGIYAFERKERAKLSKAQEKRLRGHLEASAFFESQPPGYRATAIHWVISAKQAETQERRLSRLIADSAAGLRLAQLRRPTRASGKKRRT
ncbi:MAG TPA: YdeI/OmpD-associated family protein [Thermoanaerobaculia bacterium]|nr:YdeI/OmpD-associated family protein [Thermoanaerobaculia bacterium]